MPPQPAAPTQPTAAPSAAAPQSSVAGVASSLPGAGGPTVSLSALAKGASDYQASIIAQYNAMPVYQNQGIQFAPDPSHPGNIIQVQGLTPTQQAQASLSLQNTETGLTTNTGLDFQDALDAAVSSGQYTGTGQIGKQTREALIASLTAQYGKSVDPASIAASVYNAIPDATGKSVTANDVTNMWDEQATIAKNAPTFQTAQQALDKLKASISKVNYKGSKLSPGYLADYVGLQAKVRGGNDPDVVNLQTSAADIIAALKALTGTGRITQQEMSAVGSISPFDTYDQAMGKVNQYADMLATAMGQNPPSQVVSSSASTPQAASPTQNGPVQVGKYQVQVVP